MTEASPTPVGVRSPTDLIEIVPALIGFRPRDSVVVIAIVDTRVVLTARLDLSPSLCGDDLDRVAAVWRRHPTADLVVIAYCAEPLLAWAALQHVDAAAPPGLVRILLHADGHRWYAAPEDAGEPYDDTASPLLVAATVQGRVVRGGREELERLVEPVRTAAEVSASLERVARRGWGAGVLAGEALALVGAHDRVPGVVELDDVTVLCLATHDAAFLDAVLLSTTPENAPARLALWLQVVRGCVPACAGGALVALGLAAWVTGDGALQVVCLQALQGRVAPTDWADFLDAVNAECVEPAAWPALREAFLADRGQGADDAVG